MERKIDTAPEEDRAPRSGRRVTGLYRGTFAGLVPLTVKTPLTRTRCAGTRSSTNST